MTLRKKAAQGVLWSGIDKLTNQLTNFLIIVYLARLLGPASFGLIGMLAIFIAVSQSLIDSGFSQALIQRSKHVSDRDLSTVFFINLAVSVLLYLSLYVSAPWIANFYDEPRLVDLSRILFLVIIVNAIGIVMRSKLTIDLDFKSITIANTVSTVIGGVAGLYSAYMGYDYWALVAMTLSSAIAKIIMLWLYSHWIPSLLFCKESCRRLFGFGSKLLVAGLVAQVVNNLYVLLIGRYFDSTQVGYITQSTNLTNNISGMIGSTLSGVTYPVMTSVNDQRDRMVAIYRRLIEATMLVTLPAMIGFALIAEPFVELFLGDAWLPIVPIIIILCFARIITPISGINLGVLNAIGRSDLFLRVDLSKLPMTISAVLLSAPHGVNAVAWAMLATTFISYFINAYYPGKLFGFGAIAQLKVAWRIIIATLLMSSVLFFINMQNPAAEIILKIALGIFIYTSMLLILRVEAFTQALRLGLSTLGFR